MISIAGSETRFDLGGAEGTLVWGDSPAEGKGK